MEELPLHNQEQQQQQQQQQQKVQEGLPGLIHEDDHQTDDDTTRDFYNDSPNNNVQRLYAQILWGPESSSSSSLMPIGRYDLLTTTEKKLPEARSIIRCAQQNHENAYLQLLMHVTGHHDENRMIVVDFGCGDGRLLRRMWEAGLLLLSSSSRDDDDDDDDDDDGTITITSTGVDTSASMCARARQWNQQLGCDADILIRHESSSSSSSFFHTNIPENSVDLVMATEALWHVGPHGQAQAIDEARRILKPGGWMIFNDILQNENVDPRVLPPIVGYRTNNNSVGGSVMGTIRNYQRLFAEAGFGKFRFEPHSSNVAVHYAAVLQVLQQKRGGSTLGFWSPAWQSQKMEADLQAWVDLAPHNLEWGILMAQKKVLPHRHDHPPPR